MSTVQACTFPKYFGTFQTISVALLKWNRTFSNKMLKKHYGQELSPRNYSYLEFILFLQLLSFHSCSCFKTNKSAYTWHQSLFPQVVNHFFSGQDCCWSGGKPTWGWRIKVGWNFIWFPCHKKQAFTTCIARGGLRSWPCWSRGKPTCVNVKTTFKSCRTCFLSGCKWNKVEIWIRMQT